MFYYLYEIRNNINGKIYVGVHKTRNLDDGYMGSGKVINASIKKNGIENFTKTILEHFDSAEAMYAREKEVVTDEFLSRDDTYNLRRGGSGGFDYINKNNFSGTENRRGVFRTHNVKQKISTSLKDAYASGRLDHVRQLSADRLKLNRPMDDPINREKVSRALTGISLTEEHKRNISRSLKGRVRRNGNLGKRFPNRKKRNPVETRIVTCPHCGKVGGIHGMTRWHFDNCKLRG